jgi:soluble lytic murein transglycosylase-like protein
MAGDRTIRPAPLFDRQEKDRSFVPTKSRRAGARSGGPGRPLGRRASALPWTPASPPARWRHVAAAVLAAGFGLFPGVGWGQDASPQNALNLNDLVREAAVRFAIPEPWIRHVMGAESTFRVRAVSPAGAMGLMQLMPRTYAELRVRYGLGGDPFGARNNILAGAAYLREMYDRYGAPGFLAAYNAGPGRYDQYLLFGRALPVGTRVYVAALAPKIGNAPAGPVRVLPSPPSLFVAIGAPAAERTAATRTTALAGTGEGLFATLTPQRDGR